MAAAAVSGGVGVVDDIVAVVKVDQVGGALPVRLDGLQLVSQPMEAVLEAMAQGLEDCDLIAVHPVISERRETAKTK